MENLFSKLKVGDIYKWQEIKSILEENGYKNFNVTALTYNRWNKGMNEIEPLFEWMEQGMYKYLGANYPYSGIVSHFPQGEYQEFQIAEWNNGELKFLNPDINNFVDWKNSRYEGLRIITINSMVTAEVNDKTVIKLMLSTESGGTYKGYGKIGIRSQLAKLLLHGKEGDVFDFNNNKYEILSIDN